MNDDVRADAFHTSSDTNSHQKLKWMPAPLCEGGGCRFESGLVVKKNGTQIPVMELISADLRKNGGFV